MPVLLLKNQKKNVGKLEICNQTEISADLNILGISYLMTGENGVMMIPVLLIFQIS